MVEATPNSCSVAANGERPVWRFFLRFTFPGRWCRWNTLVLDDPVQHIDDYRALNLAEVLASIRRTGRQVIIAVEDVALADVLCPAAAKQRRR